MTFYYFNYDFIAILPELYLLLGINFILIYSVIYCTSSYLNFPLLLTNISWLCIQILTIAFFLNINNFVYNLTIFNNLLIIDLFGNNLKTVVLTTCICLLIMSLNYNKYENINNFEFPLLLLLAVIGTLLLISSYDLMSTYLSLELQSFCSYLLAAFKRNSEFSAEAGLKYFILGAFASGFLLFGCSLIYGFTGTTSYKNLFLFSFNLNYNFLDINGFLIGIIFLTISFLFKISAAPFHFWSPDIYEGSPTIITTFFVVIPKLGIFIFFLRLFFDSFYTYFFFWQNLLIFCSFSSLIIGSLGAIYQVKLKRLLAYSGINHVGFMLIGLCCSSIEGIYSLIFYLLTYILISIFTFLFLLILRKNSNLKKIKYIDDFVIVSKTNPFLGLSLTICFFSIAGIPPFIGFFSKMFIFFSYISQSTYFLAIIAIFSSVLSCFYYLRIIQFSFFEHTVEWISIKKISKEESFILSILTFLLSIFIFHSNFFILLIHNIVLYLCLQ
jgi:NADH-quinone oxidoreductase subunit N